MRAEPALRPDALDLDRANGAGLVISRAEAAVVHRDLGLDRALYWDETADQLAEAERLTAIDYLDAQRIRAELADVLARRVRRPRRAGDADHAGRRAAGRGLRRASSCVLSRNAIPWSLVGFPAISVPCGFTSEGLPVGLQIVAPPGREDIVVALGAAVERATPVPRFAALSSAPTG